VVCGRPFPPACAASDVAAFAMSAALMANRSLASINAEHEAGQAASTVAILE